MKRNEIVEISKQKQIEYYLNNEKRLNNILSSWKYFPYKLLKLDAINFNLQIVIGIRGDGKTQNAKKEILFDWVDKGEKTYWIVPYKTDIDEMNKLANWHDDLLLEFSPTDAEYKEQKYSKDDIRADKLVRKMQWKNGFLLDENNEWFMRAIPLSQHTKFKQGKHPKVYNIVFDEFMREKYLTQEAIKLIDLLTSIQREKSKFTLILLGNAISLHHPLFIALSIYELDDGKVITPIYLQEDKERGIEKKLIGKIWNWKRTQKQLDERNKDNLWSDLAKATGYDNYALNNEFKNDNMSNIVQISDEELAPISYDPNVYEIAKDFYVQIHFINKKDNATGEEIYYVKITKNKDIQAKVENALHIDFVKDKIVFDSRLPENLSQIFQQGRLYYDSVASKQSLNDILKKHMFNHKQIKSIFYD